MSSPVFPEEIWIKILLYCNVPDIIAFNSTCKFFKRTLDTDYLWRMKWICLTSTAQFRFPDVECLQLLNAGFKAMCYRLHKVTNLSKNDSFPKCCHCQRYTCRRNCPAISNAKVVIEIGNKYSWVITSSLELRRHFSIFGIPKIETHVEQVLMPNTPRVSLRRKVELLSLESPSSNIAKTRGPFCLFCNPVTVRTEKMRFDLYYPVYYNYITSNPIHQKLMNGYCTDAIEGLGLRSVDVVSPAEALLSDGTFPVLKAFVDHLFHQMGLTSTLRGPNAVLMFFEPLAMHPLLRKQLLHYLFQVVKVARVCLIPKPLAVCTAMDFETCIVVDSGALSTTVAVLVGGRVMPNRWKLLPVGGWHIAYHLKQAMHWKPKEYHQIPISCLDTLDVKEHCRLSANIINKEERSHKSRLTNVMVNSFFGPPQSWKVSLGSELYIAPEVMYVSLGLPQVIKDLVSGLSEDIIEDCLSHILLTGGNTDLSGFRLRLIIDLRNILPEYRNILNVRSCPGVHSLNVAMGSTYEPLTAHSDETPPKYIEGSPFWLSREEYILFGCEPLKQQSKR